MWRTYDILELQMIIQIDSHQLAQNGFFSRLAPGHDVGIQQRPAVECELRSQRFASDISPRLTY